MEICKPEGYIFDEWYAMVLNAEKELNGNCPLIEDEVIILIDKYIKELENAVNLL